MPPQKTTAIVIRTRDYGEADRIVTVLSPEGGRLTLLALNARKSQRRFRNCLEPLGLVRLTYTEKPHRDLGRLETCELIEAHADLRRDLHRLGAAACLAELAGEVIGAQDRLPDIFKALETALSLLSQRLPPDSILCSFLIRLLALAGYGPRWQSCQVCGHPPTGPLWLNVAEGTVICQSCRPQGDGRLYPMTFGTWKLMVLAQTLPYDKLSRLRFPALAARQTLALGRGFIRQLLGRELKSFEFLYKIDKGAGRG